MKKRKLFLWLTSIGCAMFAFAGFSACQNNRDEKDDAGNILPQPPEAELNGFSTSPSLIVTPGTSVFIADPLTTDEYGNVLSVTHSVKDENGADVELDSDRFFAMSGTYDVTYEAVQSDGVKKTITKTVYVMNENHTDGMLFSDEDLDLTKYLPKTIPEGYRAEYTVESVRLKGENVPIKTEIKNNLLLKSAVNEGCYRVYVTLRSEESSFDYYSLDVDFYGEEWQWNPQVNASYAVSFDNWCANTYPVETENKDLGNGEKTWFKVSRAAFPPESVSGESVRFTLLPVHSKEYYETYRGMGCDLSFDYSYCFTENATLTTRVSVGVSDLQNGKPNEVHTATLSLDNLLDLWDTIVWSESQPEAGSQSEELSFIRFLDNQKEALTCYIGNFRVNEPIFNVDVGAPPVRRENVTLTDVTGRNNYVLSDVFTEEEKAGFSKYGENIRWVLKNRVSEFESTDGTINFSDVPFANYDAYATSADGKNRLLFRGALDFYDSAQKPTWNTVSEANLGYLQGWAEGTSNLAIVSGAEYEAAELEEEGHTGQYFRLGVFGDGNVNMHYNVLPVHSEAYYREYADYTLTFDYRVPASQYYNAGFCSTARNPRAEPMWQTAEIDVSVLLEKWKYISGEKATSAENGSMTFFTSVSNTNPLYTVYLGNIGMKEKRPNE